LLYRNITIFLVRVKSIRMAKVRRFAFPTDREM